MKQPEKIEEYILIKFQLRKEMDKINNVLEFYNSLLVNTRNKYFEMDKLIEETEKK